MVWFITIESAIPLLEQNISENAQYYTLTKPHALVLDWNVEELPEEVRALGELDAIVYVFFENVILVS